MDNHPWTFEADDLWNQLSCHHTEVDIVEQGKIMIRGQFDRAIKLARADERKKCATFCLGVAKELSMLAKDADTPYAMEKYSGAADGAYRCAAALKDIK